MSEVTRILDRVKEGEAQAAEELLPLVHEGTAAAAEAMRQILIDAARKKGRLKRGGDWQRLDLEEVPLEVETEPAALLAVNEVLDDFACEDPAKAELVKLRFLAGLSLPQAAQTLGPSLATAKRSWAFARAWLYRRLTQSRQVSSERASRFGCGSRLER